MVICHPGHHPEIQLGQKRRVSFKKNPFFILDSFISSELFNLDVEYKNCILIGPVLLQEETKSPGQNQRCLVASLKISGRSQTLSGTKRYFSGITVFLPDSLFGTNQLVPS
jgi:hypothetical protein